MRKPKLHENHNCCPQEWRGISNMTGSYELDAVIAKNPNRDMADRLENHLVEDVAYKLNTAYGRGPIC